MPAEIRFRIYSNVEWIAKGCIKVSIQAAVYSRTAFCHDVKAACLSDLSYWGGVGMGKSQNCQSLLNICLWIPGACSYSSLCDVLIRNVGWMLAVSSCGVLWVSCNCSLAGNTCFLSFCSKWYSGRKNAIRESSTRKSWDSYYLWWVSGSLGDNHRFGQDSAAHCG